MGKVLIENLAGILGGVALVLTAITALVSVVLNRAKLNSVEKKVDGGITQLQTALADIAKTTAAAVTTPQPRAIRSTDLPKTEP